MNCVSVRLHCGVYLMINIDVLRCLSLLLSITVSIFNDGVCLATNKRFVHVRVYLACETVGRGGSHFQRL